MNRWILGLVVVPLLCADAWAAIVVNESFENGTSPPAFGSFTTLYTGNTSITGWEVTGHSVDWINGYWNAYDGTKSIDLAGLGNGGVLQKNIPTQAGYKYQLQFAMAGNPDNGPQTKTMLVQVDGLPVQEFSFNTSGHSRSAMGWTVYTLDFVAGGSSEILSFSNKPNVEGYLPYWGAALDAVTVEELGRVESAIPEPATLTVWSLLGLSGAGMWMVRRRKVGDRAAWSEESRTAIHEIVGRGRA